MNSNFFDKLETRSSDERDSDNLIKLKKLINKAKENKIHKNRLNESVQSLSDLKNIEILRKSDLTQRQIEKPPFGDLNLKPFNNFAHIYRSPGPIYDLDGHKEN